jgi:hypothetical protein
MELGKKALSDIILLTLLFSAILTSLLSEVPVVTLADPPEPPYYEDYVPVRGTYLLADDVEYIWDDNGDGILESHNVEAPLIVDLDAAGFKPGDWIFFSCWGRLQYSAPFQPNWIVTSTGLTAVFSTADIILWDRSTPGIIGPLNRVPSAISCDGFPYVYDQTFFGTPCDIPEDFYAGNGAIVQIPAGARYLVIAIIDSLYSDNGGWFKVAIEKDSDGDGLRDSWEIKGIDYNDDGIIDLDLPALGANWDHKDIFVEVDYMGSDGTHSHLPDSGAIDDVIAAFANAPVDNPDGIPGIRLHVDVDDEIPHQNVIKAFDDFDNLKSNYFGTADQRSSANSPNILDAKRMVYRYCLFVHQYDDWNTTTSTWVTTTSSGIAECPGNDFIVSLGGFSTNPGTRDQQAGTFMHELGHTLGLRHGGGDDINYKPNYLSIMSYAFQFANFNPWRDLDYSRKKLYNLYEGSLDEPLGIQGAGIVQYTMYNNSKKGYELALVDGPIDWNGNRTYEYLVRANINNFPKFGYVSVPDEWLEAYDDWSNLIYDFRGTAGFADGVHAMVADQEITWEIVEAMQEAIQAMHDVAIINVTASETVVSQGSSLQINVTAINQGGNDETFSLIVYANETSIASQTVTLTRLNPTTITFTWNTAGAAEGNYTISAYATPVTDETDTADNTYTDDTVTVTTPTGIWSSDSAGDLKDEFQPDETVYVTTEATGGRVTFYSVIDRTVWDNGDPLTDVSDGPETLTLNPSGKQTIQIWANAVPGKYDIVMDVDNDGVFDAGLDLVDSVLIAGFFVVPEYPLGTILSITTFITALMVYKSKRTRVHT